MRAGGSLDFPLWSSGHGVHPSRLCIWRERGQAGAAWLAQRHKVMESGSEVLSPIIFLLGSPGFALLLEAAASKGLCLQRDTLPRCHRAGVLILLNKDALPKIG